MERTLIMIKPEGVQRKLVGQIISRFETKGFCLQGLKFLTASQELAERHYEEHRGKSFFERLTSHLSSGPVVCMVWQGPNVVKSSRMMIGETNPVHSLPGTLRGDFAVEMENNVVHGSDSVESAQREIDLWMSQ